MDVIGQRPRDDARLENQIAENRQSNARGRE
jgi:hypothetical protein